MIVAKVVRGPSHNLDNYWTMRKTRNSDAHVVICFTLVDFIRYN